MVLTTVAPARESPSATTHGPSELERRILDAACVLVARWGVSKTSLSDLAREAGCSRATIYRAFPGGKHELLASLAEREIDAYLTSVVDAVDAAADLEDAATDAMVTAAGLLAEHDAAQFIVAHEPGLLVPFIGFKEVDGVYARVRETVGPHFERFVAPERAAWLAEWLTRTFISYVFKPADQANLVDAEATRRLVRTYVLPAFEGRRTSSEPTKGSPA